jgi:hypothetical protein
MKIRLQIQMLIFSAGVLAVFSLSAFSTDLSTRVEYNLAIPKISIGFDNDASTCSRVRIYFDKEDDFYVITQTDDMFVKVGRNGQEKKIFREPESKAYQLTNFEVEQINKVCKGFISTLEQFEKDLQNENWGKCLYLDAYFPNFLNGFYYMMLMAKAGSDDVPSDARIDEKLYDISLTSSKTEARIRAWCTSMEYIVSLRIAAKELAYELKTWQKKELTNSKREPEFSQDSGVFKSLVFFENLYFNKTKAIKQK